jgi:hypothetical protein
VAIYVAVQGPMAIVVPMPVAMAWFSMPWLCFLTAALAIATTYLADRWPRRKPVA